MLKKKNNKLIFNHIGIFVENIKKKEKYLNNLFNISSESKIVPDKKLGIKAKLYFDQKKNML